MRLHGHTRLELTDIHTGAVEVVEKDNIITNAVGEIFNGYGGSLNKAMLLWRGQQDDPNAPKDLVTMFYGGLLLYDSPLGADPATRFAPAAAGITGTAIAGLVNATTNTTRGSANLTETKLDPAGGTMTYVYEFATNQGNGVIQSVCLTRDDRCAQCFPCDGRPAELRRGAGRRPAADRAAGQGLLPYGRARGAALCGPGG